MILHRTAELHSTQTPHNHRPLPARPHLFGARPFSKKGRKNSRLKPFFIGAEPTRVERARERRDHVAIELESLLSRLRKK